MDIRDSKAAIDYLIQETKKTHDVSWLVKRLREHERTITPELRDYIATLLEQKYKSKKLTKHCPSPPMIVLSINSFKAILGGKTEMTWSDVSEALKNIGIQDEAFDTKGKITETAKAMAMCYHGLTKDKLDEATYPRKHRKKFR